MSLLVTVLAQGCEAALLLMLQQMALRLELLDPREAKYMLNRPENLRHDLGTILQRWEDLQDAPLVEDSLRFPSRNAALAALEQNRLYKTHLENRLSLNAANEEWLLDVVGETNQLQQVWDAICYARNENNYVSERRRNLLRLRELLGHEAYYAADLPPPVPWWRFEVHDKRVPAIIR